MDTKPDWQRLWLARWTALTTVILVASGSAAWAQTNFPTSAQSKARQTMPPAVVSGLSAVVTEKGTVVRWQTVSETGVLSFDLYRAEGANVWRKVNAETILADNSLAGGSYQTQDANAPAGKKAVYKLAGWDQRNQEHVLGIFSIVPTPVAAETTNGVAAKTPLHILAQSSPPPPANLSVAALDGNTFIKITTTNTGMQVLTAEVLASVSGDALTNVQEAIVQRQFRLTNRGESVGYLTTTNGSALLFYALAYKDNYTHHNVFWLTSGTAPAPASVDGQSPPANTNAAHYPAVLNQENDLLTVMTLPLNPEDDFWMWTRLVAGLSLSDTVTYRPLLDRVATNATGPALLSLEFFGANDLAHRAEVRVNGQVLTNADWSGIAPLQLTLPVSPLLLTNGSNHLTIKALVNGAPSPRSQWYVNRFALIYPRQFFAQAGKVEFSANSNSIISLNGFSSSAVTVLEISSPKTPVVVSNLNVEAVSTNYRVSFVPSAPDARYVAFQSGAGVPVATVALAEMSGLASTTNAANYVLITPDSLLSAATNLAAYRQQKGWQPRLARLDPIYNEFSDGFVTPHAIERFLATARTNWSLPPRSAVLIGDGTYDYRNLLGHGDNLNPPLLIRTPFGLFASDIALGDGDGDGSPELAIGRLSGNNLTEITQLINKIKAYEAQAEPNPAHSLLIADAPDFTAGDFEAGMRQVAAVLSNKFTSVVLPRTNQPDASTMIAAVTNTWNQGMDLVNYAGHGAVDRFGNEGYLTSINSTNLISSRLPVVIAITCVAGQFSVPNTDCLGEYLLRKTNGGAIAVIAPTGLSFNNEAMQLNLRLAELLKANALASIGDIFRQAMSDHRQLDHPSQSIGIYNLLGDPAMRYNMTADLRVTSAIITNQTLQIGLSGGHPPFQLERKLSLDLPWVPYGAPFSSTNALLPLDDPAAFFRIRWE